MKKAFPYITLCLVIVLGTLMLTSCGEKKEAITSKEFKSILGSGFEYSDLTDQYKSSDPTALEVIYAKGDDGLELQYWRNRDKLSAASSFHEKRHKIEKYCPNGSEWEKGKDETLFVEGENTTIYFKAAKVDDTVIYAVATRSNKDNVDKLFKKLGYDNE